jgi:hypothetical protein
MNLKSLTEISKYSKGIFFISVIIFLLSLIPVSYTAGYSNGLSGGAGIGSEPTEPTKEAQGVSSMHYYITLLSGVIGSVALATSAFTNTQRARIERRTEEMKYKKIQLEYEMQMKEIEILRMELEKEKLAKRKKKQTANQ